VVQFVNFSCGAMNLYFGNLSCIDIDYARGFISRWFCDDQSVSRFPK